MSLKEVRLRKHVRLLPLILLISGAVALGAQVVWLRYFALIFGNSMTSFSWVTSLFMLGLSTGALASPLIFKDRVRSNLYMYLQVECLALVFLAISFFTVIEHGLGLAAWLGTKSFFVEGLLASSLILPVTFLMGTSFPLICRSYRHEIAIEKLYSFNTMGGAVGLMLFGFMTLVVFGYKLTAALIIALGLIGLGLVLWVWKQTQSDQVLVDGLRQYSGGFRKKAIGAALSGASLLMMEVLWFRHLEIILGDRAYLTTIILFIIILVMGFVASLVPGLLKIVSRKQLVKIIIPTLLLCYIISSLLLPSAAYAYYGFPRWTLVKMLYLVFSFLIPLVLLSLIFPVYLSKSDDKSLGQKDTATLLFLNALVGGAGSLLASYLLIENFGVNSIYVLTSLLLVCLLINEQQTQSKETAMSVILFTLLAYNLSGKELRIAPEEMIVYDKELAQSHFTLLQNNNQLEMYSGNYRIASPFGGEHVEHAQVGLAKFPRLFRQKIKNALTMGLGYGITVRALLDIGVKNIDSVEILPPVLKSADYFYSSNLLAHLEESQVEHHLQDARNYLTRTNKRYDLISANTSSPYSLSGSFFLTREFYKQVVGRLEKGGVFSQLVWGPHLPEILHTFESVFPYVKAVPGYTKRDLILVGSMEPLVEIDGSDVNLKDWPSFESIDLKELLEMGKEKLSRLRSEVPEFVISDHKVDILFAKESYMGVFWTYKK